MYKVGKVYVPKDEKLKAEIVRLHHDMLIGGHGGQWKMVELVIHNFWWPGVTKEIKQYVKEYDALSRTGRSRSGVGQSGVELLRNRWGLTTK